MLHVCLPHVMHVPSLVNSNQEPQRKGDAGKRSSQLNQVESKTIQTLGLAVSIKCRKNPSILVGLLLLEDARAALGGRPGSARKNCGHSSSVWPLWCVQSMEGDIPQVEDKVLCSGLALEGARPTLHLSPWSPRSHPLTISTSHLGSLEPLMSILKCLFGKSKVLLTGDFHFLCTQI